MIFILSGMPRASAVVYVAAAVAQFKWCNEFVAAVAVCQYGQNILLILIY